MIGTCQKFKIGFLIPDTLLVSKFEHMVLENVMRLDCIESIFFATVTVDASQPSHRPMRRLPFLVLNRIEKLIATRLLKAPDLDLPVSIESLRPRFPFVALRADRRKGLFDWFDEPAITTLREHDPDILIRFAGRILKGEVLKVARYGVWSYHHADNRINRGGPPGFWEWFERSPVTGVVVQKLNADLDNGVVLARQSQETVSLSWNANRLRSFELSVPMMADTVRKFADGQLDLARLESSARQLPLNPYSKRLFVAPPPMSLGPVSCKWAWRAAAEAGRTLFTAAQWNLLLAPNHQKALSLRNYKRVVAPTAVFWADPFIVGNGSNGELFVAVEEFDYAAAKGHISLLTIRDGVVLSSTPIIKNEYHCSYPFILRHDDDLYMIPECGESGRMDAFRCTEFPYRWERCKTLMKGISGVDPTVVSHNGRWWMFLNVVRGRLNSCANLELSLFSADHPLSDHWTPHRMNPVISDVTQARNAGRPFVLEDGRLVRPAQDCSVSYGHGIRLLAIEELSDDCYRQVEVARIKPDWMPGLRGVHHVDHNGEYIIMDYCRSIAKGILGFPTRSKQAGDIGVS
jgi:hypothetical protein